VDAVVRDCAAALAASDGEVMEGAAKAAVDLLAMVASQDFDEEDYGAFRIARRVVADRVISTVAGTALHSHRSHDRRLDLAFRMSRS